MEAMNAQLDPPVEEEETAEEAASAFLRALRPASTPANEPSKTVAWSVLPAFPPNPG